MAYLLDGIILALFAVMVLVGIKRGFIKTISGLLSFVLALILAALLAAPAASLAYDAFIEPQVLSSFGVDKETGEITADQVNDAMSQMPAFVTDQLSNHGITTGQQVLDQVDEGSAGVAQDISDQVVAPTAKAVLEPICMLLLFIILRCLLGWLLGALNLLAKIPGIKQVNKLLGVVAGVVLGLLWVCFAVSVMDVLAATGWIASLTPEVLHTTVLVEWITAINPLGSALQSFVIS